MCYNITAIGALYPYIDILKQNCFQYPIKQLQYAEQSPVIVAPTKDIRN